MAKLTFLRGFCPARVFFLPWTSECVITVNVSSEARYIYLRIALLITMGLGLFFGDSTHHLCTFLADVRVIFPSKLTPAFIFDPQYFNVEANLSPSDTGFDVLIHFVINMFSINVPWL